MTNQFQIELEDMPAEELMEVLAMIKSRTLASLDGLLDITEPEDLPQLGYIKKSQEFLNESTQQWIKILKIFEE